MQRPPSLNHIYRLAWSHILHTWVAVAENVRGSSKTGSGAKRIAAMLAALLTGAIATSLAMAAPSGGVVSAGNGSINQSGLTTIINQHSTNLAIDWNTFSTSANEAIIFNQPSASAIALNRILGSDPSVLLGSLSANGHVFILNPNGVLFGGGARVNVGGLVASTLSLSNDDFMAGRYSFSGHSTNSVINQGSINANDGYVALLAATVRNEGNISTTQGTTLLGAGDKITLNLDNGSLLGYSIDQGSLHALAENKQLIQADGGQVYLTAKAADSLSTAVVNNTGIIEARSLQNKNGVIKLIGDMEVGQVNVGGTLDASAPNGGDGGFIETSASKVKLADGAVITTNATSGNSGTWLIDPTDFTVAASGGDISGAALSSNLGNNNVIIQSSNGASGSNRDINVNDVVSWDTANTLTLHADNDININQSITASNTNGKLALEYGQGAVASGNTSNYNVNAPVNLQAGNNFSTKLGSDGTALQYTVITSLGAEGSTTGSDLQGMNGNLSRNYALGGNIDASTTANWNNGAGFDPIKGTITPNFAEFFTGNFDGLGHTINNLVINRPEGYPSLFALVSGSTLQNVGLVNGNMLGGAGGGSLVGEARYSIISNVYNTGSVSGRSGIGGIAGSLIYGTTLTNSYNTGTVTGTSSNLSYEDSGGLDNFGGLVGLLSTGSYISNSYNTGNVTGNLYVGGIFGSNLDTSTITNVYSTGSVKGMFAVGGLAGANIGAINNSYSTGAVTGNDNVGGLVGKNSGIISNTYSTGYITGNNNVGGLVGEGNSTVTSSYWNTQTSGQGASAGGAGLTITQMMNSANFANWDFSNTWAIAEGSSLPYLTFNNPVTPPNPPRLPQLSPPPPVSTENVVLDDDALTNAYNSVLQIIGSNPAELTNLHIDLSSQDGDFESNNQNDNRQGEQQHPGNAFAFGKNSQHENQGNDEHEITPRLASKSCGVNVADEAGACE